MSTTSHGIDNDRALPRARFTGEVLPAPQDLKPAHLRALARQRPGAIYLEGHGGRQEAPCPAARSAEVSYLTDEPDEVRLWLSAPCRGFVVLADMYFAGWTARIDGQETVIFRANKLYFPDGTGLTGRA
jgi:hypothetical protein